METNQNAVICPNCHTPINVSDILYHQVEKQLSDDFERKQAEREQQFAGRETELRQQAEELKRQQAEMHERVEADLKLKLATEKEKLEKSIAGRLREENEEQVRLMQKELTEKTEQLRELNRTKAEIERLKREKEEMREALTLEKEREFNEKLRTEKLKLQTEADEQRRRLSTMESELEKINREKNSLRETIVLEKERELTEKLGQEKLRIRTELEEHNALRIKDLEKQLEDQKKQAEEMLRKAEQKSMQLQGEVQELAIEEWLRQQFPLDEVEEVKKGQLGADCIQTINTYSRSGCGKICYESKRTKNFSSDWIPKLKEDIRRANAGIGVLVTQVLPKEIERMGLVDGVWVCTFEEFKGLCTVLRQGMIDVSNAVATQENKGDKMTMLYDYLTGNEFRAQVESIVEGFSQMRTGLQKERNVALKNFAEREKMIDKVLTNTVTMYGSIKGIAGNAVQDIPALEGDGGEE